MGKSKNIPFLLLVFGVLLAFAHSYLIGWHNVSVDVGALRYFALRLDWADPTSFHNGFYPSFSIFLVKVVGPKHWSLVGTILSNILLGYSLLISYKLIQHYLRNAHAAIIATLILAISPGFFSVFTSAMPDSIMVALFISGLYAVLCKQHWFLGGLLLGLAASTRYHGLLLACLSFVLFLHPSNKYLRAGWFFILGFLIIYSQQMIFSWMATGNVFSNDQLYNIFKTFYRNDIGDASQLQLPNSLLGVITHNSGVFWPKYWTILQSKAIYILLPAVAALLLKEHRAFLLRISLLIGLYIGIASLGGSPRMYAPIAVLIAIVLGFIYKCISLEWLRIGLALVLFHFLCLENVLALSVQRQNQRANETIKLSMLKLNPSVRREAIFSSYYDYTWEDIPGLIGYGTERAWLRHGDKWFAKNFEAPKLNSSAHNFYQYCRRNKIEFTILNKAKIGPVLYQEIQNSSEFRLLAKIPVTRPRMTHRYQILSKQFDEIYVFLVLDN